MYHTKDGIVVHDTSIKKYWGIRNLQGGTIIQ